MPLDRAAPFGRGAAFPLAAGLCKTLGGIQFLAWPPSLSYLLLACLSFFLLPLFLGFLIRDFAAVPAGPHSGGGGPGLLPAGMGPVHLAGLSSRLGGGAPIGDRGLTGDRLLGSGDLLRDRLGDTLTSSSSDSSSSISGSKGLLRGSSSGVLFRLLSHAARLAWSSSAFDLFLFFLAGAFLFL